MSDVPPQWPDLPVRDDTQRCACGRPLHYYDAATENMVRNMVARLGTHTVVKVLGVGTYSVPRHYIALHGVKGEMLPHIAATYGFKKISDG